MLRFKILSPALLYVPTLQKIRWDTPSRDPTPFT